MHRSSASESVRQPEGVKAKASFLLSTLHDANSLSAERTIAALGLFADVDDLIGNLERDDIAALRRVVEGTLSTLERDAGWSELVLPSEAVSGAEAIEGLNVQCAVVGPTETVVVAKFAVPQAGPVKLAMEYSLAATADATVEVRDVASSELLGSVQLTVGFNTTTNVLFEAANGQEVRIEVENSSSGVPVRCYSCRLSSAAPRPQSATEAVRSSVESERKATRSSFLSSVTAEPLTLSDIDRLSSLKDAFAGERIFVMGNGPSLNETPLDKLDGEFVFGLNRISLLFDRVSWRPTFFTAFDVRVVPDNKEEFAELDTPYKFFSARYKDLLGERDNHYWHHTKGFYEGFESCFDPTVVYSGFGGGGTVAVIAIELAFFMGFREINLIGTDVSYTVKETVSQAGPDQFGDGVGLELESTEDDDSNHFDPRYFGKGKKWHNPNVREMKIGFARAAHAIERRGGSLRNATVGGELNEVARVDFDSLF